MAVELCKVSLWLEALEPGKPLTFLDHHIKCGNSLLGTTPALLAQGIPDDAFTPIEGDDKKVAAALKKRNRAEREGQLSLGEAGLELPLEELAEATQKVDAHDDETAAQLREKEIRHAAVAQSAEYLEARRLADTWLGAFVANKTESLFGITTAALSRASDHLAETKLDSTVNALALEYRFFHWWIEFADVAQRGGFDTVVGNPPWERVKLQEVEFFEQHDAMIAGAKNAAERKKLIAKLPNENPQLWDAFQAALRHADGESHLLRRTGRYPLAGRGDVNTYAVFAELCRSLLALRGRAGVIVPTGIATDATTQYFFADLVGSQTLAALYGFENEAKLFPAVDHRVKFCILAMSGPAGPIASADFVFFARDVGDLSTQDRHFTLSRDDFRILNPNTLNCPTFRSRRDAEIAISVHMRIPVLAPDGAAGSGWDVSYLRMFDMAGDSALFHDDFAPDRLPLFEAKMVHQYDHRYGTYEGQSQAQAAQGILPRPSESEKADPRYQVRPRYWLKEQDVDRRLEGRAARDWQLVWRDISRSTDERTLISAVLPRVAVGHHAPLVLSRRLEATLLVANFNSFAIDWIARQKVGGTHVTFFIMNQLPVIPASRYHESATWTSVPLGDWVRRYVAELTYTSWDLEAYARALGFVGEPFRWDGDRRAQLRAELDAAYFHLYELSADDVGHVMDSFSVVHDRDTKKYGTYRTKRLVLDAYQAMASGSTFESKLAPVAGDAALTLHPADGSWGDWREISVPDATRGIAERGPGDTRMASHHPHTTNPPGASEEHTQSMSDALAGLITETGWAPEEAVNPRDLVVGVRVRHARYGEGVILGVRDSERSSVLTIRFSAGERELAFGYGVLDFNFEA